MGIIASVMGVAEAMVVHGIVQSISNSSRAWLLLPDIRWDILGYKLLGALPAIALLSMIAFIPNKATLFIVLGLLPFILWLPKGVFQGDAAKPSNAIACGIMVMGLNLTAGVAGPALDFFYVKTSLNRKEIVATKAVTMNFLFRIAAYCGGGPHELAPALDFCRCCAMHNSWHFYRDENFTPPLRYPFQKLHQISRYSCGRYLPMARAELGWAIVARLSK